MLKTDRPSQYELMSVVSTKAEQLAHAGIAAAGLQPAIASIRFLKFLYLDSSVLVESDRGPSLLA